MKLITDIDTLVNEILKMETVDTTIYDKYIDFMSFEIFNNESMFYILAIYNHIVQDIEPDGRLLKIPDQSKSRLIHSNNSVFGMQNEVNPLLNQMVLNGGR